MQDLLFHGKASWFYLGARGRALNRFKSLIEPKEGLRWVEEKGLAAEGIFLEKLLSSCRRRKDEGLNGGRWRRNGLTSSLGGRMDRPGDQVDGG